MSSIFRRVAVSVALLGVMAAAAEAQEPPASARAFGFGVGLGAATMSVSGESRSTLGINILGRIGLDSGNRFLVMAELNPIDTDSPIAEESFRTLNLLAAFGFGGTFRVRPGLGVQFRSWSGPERVEASDSGLLLALDFSREFRRGERFSLSPEILFRWSLIEIEGGVGSRFIGLQLVASWRY